MLSLVPQSKVDSTEKILLAFCHSSEENTSTEDITLDDFETEQNLNVVPTCQVC
jgi:hypothetical protein